MAISNFGITFGKEDGYRPGETLTGQVVLDVWCRTEIGCLELTLSGRGTVRIFKNRFTFIERPKHELYLDERSALISPPGGATALVLEPGRYVSAFSYRLPDGLPPSVHQFDVGDGCVFDVSYAAEATVRGAVQRRPIKSTRRGFDVLPLVDWQSLPGARRPVRYTERLLLFCSCASRPTTVRVTLDRAVYPVGGTIRVGVTVVGAERRQPVRAIRTSLERRMAYGGGGDDLMRKFRKTLLAVEDDVEYSPDSEVRSAFDLPVPGSIVPSYLPHCAILDVTYVVKIVVKFKAVGGKLTIAVPVVLAPTVRDHRSTPAYLPLAYDGADRSSSTAYASSQDTEVGTSDGRGQPPAQDQITTKYRTGLRCCPCCLLFCRFGIYDDDLDKSDAIR